MNEIKTGTSKSSRKPPFNFNSHVLPGARGEAGALRGGSVVSDLCWIMSDCEFDRAVSEAIFLIVSVSIVTVVLMQSRYNLHETLFKASGGSWHWFGTGSQCSVVGKRVMWSLSWFQSAGGASGTQVTLVKLEQRESACEDMKEWMTFFQFWAGEERF